MGTWYGMIENCGLEATLEQGRRTLFEDVNHACPGRGCVDADIVGYQWGRLPLDSGGDGRPALALAPQCASGPPTEWHTQRENTTAFALAADAGIPPGQYSVQVGLRDRATGAPLPLADGSTALPIATLKVSVR